jgi:2-keto-4-pentenoate hydratase/2-oxohepta-3-ene-1,7-dioic acid hydratase in catechol pathway
VGARAGACPRGRAPATLGALEMTHAQERRRDTVWIGRATRAGDRRERTIRIRTAGEAPGPDALVEEIEDPFLAAQPHLGADPTTDPAQLAAHAPAIEDGLSGPLSRVELAPPVRPSKIVCIGRNYRAHAEEMGNEVPEEPILFFKPSSSLLAAADPLDLPRGYERIDMESELVAVIGKVARAVAPEHALEHVAGYTLGNDVSNRDLQKSDKQWTRAKGFDGFAPCGPLVRIAPGSAGPPPDARIRGWYADELVQDAPLSAMIFDLPFIIAYISRVMTLLPGDLLFTGTPAGVTALSPGGVVRIELHGWELGRLVTPLR